MSASLTDETPLGFRAERQRSDLWWWFADDSFYSEMFEFFFCFSGVQDHLQCERFRSFFLSVWCAVESQGKKSPGRTRSVHMTAGVARLRLVEFWRGCSFYPQIRPEGTCAGSARSGPTDDRPLWELITEKILVKGYRSKKTRIGKQTEKHHCVTFYEKE